MKKNLTFLILIILLTMIIIPSDIYAIEETTSIYKQSESLEIANDLNLKIKNRETLENSYKTEQHERLTLSATATTKTTDNILKSPSRVYSFGNQIQVDEDQENMYFVYGNQIIKYSLKDNTRVVIHELNSEELNFEATSKNGVIYIYKNLTGNNGKKCCQIFKYDIKQDKEIGRLTINTTEYIIGDDSLYDLVVDNNGYMYFAYGDANASIISFDSNGKYIDKIENSNQSDFVMYYGTSYDDKVIFFTLPNIAATSGYIKINNGKFVDHKFWINNVGQNWRYSQDGQYAIDHMGNTIKLTYNSTDIGFKYSVILNTHRGLVAYNPAGVFDGDYLYALGTDSIFLKINLNTKKVEGRYKLQDTTLENKEIKDFKVSKGKLYIVLRENIGYNSYYYIVTKDISRDLEQITTTDINTHEAQKHSKEDIIGKYKTAKSAFNYKTGVFELEPNYASAPYVAGSLKAGVKQDTLNQLNFYRWLTGLNEVSINTQYMDRSQKGAVILARLNELTHWPSKPSDMDDKWYNEAYAGVNAGYDYSGNVSYGVRMDKSPLEFILDTNNVEKNVGHRSSMLDPRSNKTSFGYCNNYAAISMYTTSEDLGNDDIWYSWPSPGYFPIENMDISMMWSIQLDNDYSFYPGGNGLSLTLTSGDNKKYEIALNEMFYDSYYNNFYFDLPSELLNYLTDGGNTFKPGKKVTVDFCGLVDFEFNSVNIHYTTEFFESESSTLGDVNNDKKINTLDAIMILQHISKKITLTETQSLAADTSKDGKINTLDVIRILQYISKKITQF